MNGVTIILVVPKIMANTWLNVSHAFTFNRYGGQTQNLSGDTNNRLSILAGHRTGVCLISVNGNVDVALSYKGVSGQWRSVCSITAVWPLLNDS